ncbi:MAG: PleD family two-component system response regulator [Xenococcaceae cyanobacterium]
MIESTTLTKLTEELKNLSRQRATGELILRNQKVVGTLHLFSGGVLYATDVFHPVRRWDRALKRHCSNCVIEPEQLSDNQSWEYQLLSQGISEKQLSLIQAKEVIRTVVQECLFELSCHTDLTSEWKPKPKTELSLPLLLALSTFEIKTIFSRAAQMQQQWQAAGLDHLSPTLAPILKRKVHAQELPVSLKYLNGNLTLWDIAWQLEKSVIEVTRSLNPLVGKSILQFQKIPDLPVPTVKKPVAAAPSISKTKPKIPDSPVPTVKKPVAAAPPRSETKPTFSARKKPLIACIDDSPVVAHSLKKILVPAGYQMLSIQEPMHGFGQLVEHKPDLIFLDLNMPNADGYSVCKFLRNIPLFENTPIIILTAKDTLIDRTRAKLAGANDFVGKPAQAEELLQMVQKYLSGLEKSSEVGSGGLGTYPEFIPAS